MTCAYLSSTLSPFSTAVLNLVISFVNFGLMDICPFWYSVLTYPMVLSKWYWNDKHDLLQELSYWSSNLTVVCIIALKSGRWYSSAWMTLTSPSLNSVMQTPKFDELKPESRPTDFWVYELTTICEKFRLFSIAPSISLIWKTFPINPKYFRLYSFKWRRGFRSAYLIFCVNPA